MEMDMEKNLSFIELSELEKPKDGDCIVNSWWAVCPRRGALVYRETSFQCNKDENVTRMLTEKIWPWAEVKFIPTAFVGYRPR